MVKLNRIYTKTGDDGTTGLATGQRVRKDDPRVECYGTVDEANAALGEAVLRAEASPLAPILRAIQNDLFDAGADLATPMDASEKKGPRLRIIASQTERLERLIDEHNERLAPLTSFVLPGGTPLSCALHVARTAVRRAERLAVTLRAGDASGVNPEAIKYLNRLSDLLFVLARVANDDGTKDVLWIPGKNR